MARGASGGRTYSCVCSPNCRPRVLPFFRAFQRLTAAKPMNSLKPQKTVASGSSPFACAVRVTYRQAEKMRLDAVRPMAHHDLASRLRGGPPRTASALEVRRR
jgi:hypothetical protein